MPYKKQIYIFLKVRIYSELGRFTEAEQAYKNALKAVAKLQGCYGTTWAIMHTVNKISVKLVDYYIQEVTQNQAPIPLRALGRAFVELGKTDSARTLFQKAIDLRYELCSRLF